jgi:translation elongation factor EF-G
MQFDRYEEVPNNIATEIVEHRTGATSAAAA